MIAISTPTISMMKTDARLIRRLLIVMCLGCATLAAQEGAPPANPDVQTSPSVPSQPESQPTQDQNAVQNRDPAKSGAPSDSQPKAKPAKKQAGSNGSSANADGRHHAASRRVAAIPPPGAPKKIVVRQGGAEEPTAQIVTGMTAEEADRQRREAELLLGTTSERLKEIAPRPLDPQQQETVSQIQNYLEGSRRAMKQGDVSRAHTLAQKASLLAEDLASH